MMTSTLLRSLVCFAGFSLLAAPAAPDLSARFYQAIRNDDRGALEKLLTEQAGADVRDKQGTTPLMYSAAAGSVASMKLVMASGADVNAKNAFDVTALLLCAADEAKVRLLLAKGADVNARSKQGQTPLAVAAATEGSSGILKMLLAAGADLQKAEANPMNSPVLAAVGADDKEAFRLLREKGAGVQGPVGARALTMAAGNGNLEIMRALLKAGVPADQPGPPAMAGSVKNGDIQLGLLTPLHLAVPVGGIEAVKLLVDSGANVNRQDIRGMTPLMLAIGCDHADARVVRLLLEHGADPSIKSKGGETAVEWARKFNNPDILAALQITAAPAAAMAVSKPLPVDVAMQKSAGLLQQKSATFFREGGCASCHSHNVVSMALEKARDTGAWKDDAPASALRNDQNRLGLSSYQQQLMLRMDPPGGSNQISYAALQLAADQVKPDATTDAIVHNLAAEQQLDGSWRNEGVVRPPMAESNMTATALTVRVLALFAPGARKNEMAARNSRAVEWMKHADAVTAEERNMQLLGVFGAARGRRLYAHSRRRLKNFNAQMAAGRKLRS